MWKMCATPTKKSKRGRKKKDYKCNRYCRFFDVKFVSSSGERLSFENLFKKSTRGESPGMVLADCCSSVFGLWSLVFGLWSLVFGLWYLVFGIWHLILSIWCLVFCIW